ncbi:hypothetical protein QTH97_30510 [Variovorax sp. J22R24]|uniref:hypothetical protein n=1 Tax=Variovorax gracilis TaxID=3053502 RepID=UPI002576FC08|nr:hypothetical protein [Variovorax sp. J22R24]MDM0109304.1 hypothetical protein [Variovorax sp. J22R24]
MESAIFTLGALAVLVAAGWIIDLLVHPRTAIAHRAPDGLADPAIDRCHPSRQEA